MCFAWTPRPETRIPKPTPYRRGADISSATDITCLEAVMKLLHGSCPSPAHLVLQVHITPQQHHQRVRVVDLHQKGMEGEAAGAGCVSRASAHSHTFQAKRSTAPHLSAILELQHTHTHISGRGLLCGTMHPASLCSKATNQRGSNPHPHPSLGSLALQPRTPHRRRVCSASHGYPHKAAPATPHLLIVLRELKVGVH
jgi:hypothetical protein